MSILSPTVRVCAFASSTPANLSWTVPKVTAALLAADSNVVLLVIFRVPLLPGATVMPPILWLALASANSKIPPPVLGAPVHHPDRQF